MGTRNANSNNAITILPEMMAFLFIFLRVVVLSICGLLGDSSFLSANRS